MDNSPVLHTDVGHAGPSRNVIAKHRIDSGQHLAQDRDQSRLSSTPRPGKALIASVEHAPQGALPMYGTRRAAARSSAMCPPDATHTVPLTAMIVRGCTPRTRKSLGGRTENLRVGSSILPLPTQKSLTNLHFLSKA